MSQYFQNISSFIDLKRQYKVLALANHPDRGGDVAVMQAINEEYTRLYPIWVNHLDAAARPAFTADQDIHHFYTQYGWEGSRYDRHMSTKDIAAAVRQYAKENWNQWKFSITTHLASMCAEIRIELNGGPLKSAIITDRDPYTQKYGVQTRYQWGHSEKDIDERAEMVMQDVVAYCQSFNYDDSDAMIDYFDKNFYLFEVVAGAEKWKEQYKTARIKGAEAPKTEKISEAAQPALPTPHESVRLSEQGLEIVDYSPSAIAIFGDTKFYVSRFKTHFNARFNARLTNPITGERAAGWIVSRKRYSIESLTKEIGKWRKM